MRRSFIVFTILLIALTLSSCGKKQQIKKPAGPPDPWKLVSYNPKGGYGTYLGNGSIGVRLHSEGTGSHDGKPLQCLMTGLYQGESLLPLPNFSGLPIYLGEEVDKSKQFTLDPEEPYEQTLDMKSGVLRTKCTLRQGRARLLAEIDFALSRLNDRIDIRVKTTPGFSDFITVRTGIEMPSTGWKIVYSDQGSFYVRNLLRTTGQQIEEVSVFTAFAGSRTEANSSSTSDGSACDTSFKVERGKETVFGKTVVVARNGSRFNDYLIPQSKQDLAAVIKRSAESWNDLWKSRIEIDGDPHAQQAVNACLFYLLGSVREETHYSIPPMGLSNDAWHGHVFWDADTWMFPALLPQYPELAKSIVSYRYKTLPGAKQNATNRGLKGAEFAWESARTGLETIGMPFCEERHITSDVALAQWHYYLATQDRKWLADYGYPVLSACADYWTMRSKYNQSKGQYEILRVMPPDEDAEIVDNSVYTNVGAKKTLEVASEAAKLLGKRVPSEWQTVAAKMYIPFDKKNNRFIEFDGFDRKQSKQADTELLIYPLEHPMTDDVKVNTFDYWAKKVNPRGPAMSSSVHAVIAARLGRSEEAYKYFTESYKPFFRPPFCYFNEKRSEMYENMCFMTGAAGPVQAVIYGFCGLRYDDKGQISVSPNLPAKWKGMTLRNVHAAGKRFDIIIRQGRKPVIQPL